jgi:hypothetical protein
MLPSRAWANTLLQLCPGTSLWVAPDVVSSSRPEVNKPLLTMPVHSRDGQAGSDEVLQSGEYCVFCWCWCMDLSFLACGEPVFHVPWHEAFL